jgi:hypothetical protein
MSSDITLCRFHWPRALRRRSAIVRLLRLWVRIPPGAWVTVFCECCVLSGRGLCVGLITRSEESYRLWCMVVCDLETSWMRRPWPTGCCCAKRKKERNILHRVSVNRLLEHRYKLLIFFGRVFCSRFAIWIIFWNIQNLYPFKILSAREYKTLAVFHIWRIWLAENSGMLWLAKNVLKEKAEWEGSLPWFKERIFLILFSFLHIKFIILATSQPELAYSSTGARAVLKLPSLKFF